MIDLLQFAGEATSIAIANISGGEPLLPIGASIERDGQKTLAAFADKNLGVAAAMGKDWFERNPRGASGLVLIYDGYITVDDWRTDALFILIKSVDHQADLTLIQRYQAKEVLSFTNFWKRRKQFAIYRPKLNPIEAELPNSLDELWDSFNAGFQRYEKGAAVWDRYFDASR